MIPNQDSNRHRNNNALIIFFLIIISALALANLVVSATKKIELQCQKVTEIKRQFTFEEIKTLLFDGKHVRLIFDYQRLSHYINEKLQAQAPNAVSGVDIEDFEYFGVNVTGNPIPYIATSSAVLITHARYGVIYNYGKIRIYQDDRIEIGIIYIDKKTSEIKLDNNKYNSTLPSKGVFIRVED